MQEAGSAARARRGFDRWRRAAGANAFDGDAFLKSLLERLLETVWPQAEERLRSVAQRAGAELDALVAESSRDENLPRLQDCDAFGEATQEIVFHPDYHEIGRIFWSSGVLATLENPGGEVLAGAIAYLLDQHGEAGHACPVACTAGAIKLLQQVGSEPQRRRFLPQLLETDYDRRLHAAQFVTEVQGGSDVGLNACRAVADPERPGTFLLSGEKWFCSVADAGLFVVSARLEDRPRGTRGLGLFLVPRTVEGSPNGFRLRRLKSKLGTRSMATAEIEFDGALAEAIGSLDQGFKNLVGIVLDTSRVHNALAACGLMRRAFVEAREFARQRLAFDHQILDFPAVQEILARMNLRTLAALATTFRILDWSDRLDTGRATGALRDARRIAVMINKYWTALAATRTARDGIEILGGNGTIEDFSVLPRLYRDAIVVESWEGTHNTLCAQVLRDFVARRLDRPWHAQLQREIEALQRTDLAGPVGEARSLLRRLEGRIESLRRADETIAAAQIRHVVDRMCRLSDWVALATQLAWERARGLETDTAAALELYRLLELEKADPLDRPDYWQLCARLSGAAARVARPA